MVAYRALGRLSAPLVRRHLASRAQRGKEDPQRLGERFGVAGTPRPEGPLVWLHASSVGESLSILPLIGRIRAEWPDAHVLVTTVTVTSARLMAERLPAGCQHQFAPVDLRPAVARFIAHWRPSVALWVESELWPNLIVETGAQGVPMGLVNGRMSARSLRHWRAVPGIARWLLQHFAVCLAQAPEDEARLRAVGAAHAHCAGNLKFAAAPLPAEPALLAEVRAAIGDRPRWLAASTHPGEEELCGAAHARLKAGRPGLLTVIVPRHPERGPAVAAALRAQGLGVALRSAREPVGPQVDVYVADGLGELGAWFRAAGLVLMGGSLVPKGGQNPLEPARLGCAVLHGPHMTNFAQIATELAAAGGSRRIAGADALADSLAPLLADPALRMAIGRAAEAYASSKTRVLDSVMAELRPLFDAAFGARVARLARGSAAE
ncbi:MAG: 3-deoxy-D-manno-octulosonic acid transferase [Alphaproteobacteria bacterium]|nr:3-deoxy-D-manno-octulosonic acid transferase [Alphaproteobacteria bacterium]